MGCGAGLRGCEASGVAMAAEMAREIPGLLVSARDVGAEEAAFAGLVGRQAQLMFRVARAVLRNPEDAEDAVQEAFLKLYRLGGWQEAREEKAYVARVVWRVAVDRAAARGGRREGSLEDEDGGVREVAGAGETAEEGMVREGERARLRRLIDGLPEELRQPLVLCAIEEMTSGEVGMVMGLPEGTVRRRVMRAKEELRRRFMAVGERRR